MKLALLFFFAIIAPFVIFLTELLYGGTNVTTLKKGLSETTIYKDISSFLVNAEIEGPQGKESAKLSLLIYQRFTPEYIQRKNEKLMDDGDNWIRKDGPAPVLSFTDIKEDLLVTNPEFGTLLNDLPKADPQQTFSGENSLSQYAGDNTEQNELNSFVALAQNDFVVPVGKYFGGLKSFYTIMKYLHPILILTLIGTLFLLWKKNTTISSKLRWIGATFITTAVFGLGMIAFNKVAILHLADVTKSTTENFLAAFSPIMLQLMNVFMQQYAQFQIIVSIVLFVGGTICILIGRKQSPKVAI